MSLSRAQLAGHAWLVLPLVIPALLATGCATRQEIADMRARNRAPFEQAMAEVVRRVTPEHMTQCRTHAEATLLMGGKVRLTGPLVPHMKSTCVYNEWKGWGLTATPGAHAVYLASAEIDGVERLLSGRRVSGCVISLENGQIKVTNHAAPHVIHRTSPCHLL